MCDKRLITRIYMELKKTKKNSQRISNPMKKWANELNRYFSKEEVQMTNKYRKKCSTFLTVKQMPIKTTLRFCFPPVIMTIIRTNSNTCWGTTMWGKGILIYC
jgi:hypothetical protein